jgi:hypothetical protein
MDSKTIFKGAILLLLLVSCNQFSNNRSEELSSKDLALEQEEPQQRIPPQTDHKEKTGSSDTTAVPQVFPIIILLKLIGIKKL